MMQGLQYIIPSLRVIGPWMQPIHWPVTTLTLTLQVTDLQASLSILKPGFSAEQEQVLTGWPVAPTSTHWEIQSEDLVLLFYPVIMHWEIQLTVLHLLHQLYLD